MAAALRTTQELFQEEVGKPRGVVPEHAMLFDEIIEDHPTAKVPQRGRSTVTGTAPSAR